MACGGATSGPVGAAPTPTPTAAPTPTPAPTPAPSLASALSQSDARLGACVNMANMLDAPNEGEWGRAISETDFAEIKAAGFSTVRIPVRWSNHASYAAPYTINPAFMARVEHVVGLARTAGLKVILNVHHYEDAGGNIFADPAGQTARLAGLWQQIAARFADQPDNALWFELLNEPHDQLTNANLRATLEPALAQVRATNRTRPVVIGGGSWSGVPSLATLDLPNDAYLVVTVHTYDPFNFTHQGADWLTPPMPMGVAFGSTDDLAYLASNVAAVRDYTTRTGRPVFVGEYGANDPISLPERATYYRTLHDAYGAASVDGCVWGYTNSFAFRDQATGVWKTELLRALGL
ncbi:MAG: glycoside hydrolase family 5 protein [Alteraurantiacibacter sp.]